MKKRNFIPLLLWVIVFSNLGIFVLVIALSLPAINAFNMDLDTKLVLDLLVPVMAIYLIPISAYVIRNKNKRIPENSFVNVNYVLLSMLIIFTHLFLICGLILLDAYQQLRTKNLLMLAGVIEVVFGGALNLFIADLFKSPKKETVTKS
jgi:hypothetical protein